jgi:hypothetical protein
MPIHLEMLTKAIDEARSHVIELAQERGGSGVYQSYEGNTSGILRSNISHEIDRRGIVARKLHCPATRNSKKSPLLSGLDLSLYGVAIVFDNSSALHLTLVLLDAVHRCWFQHRKLNVFVAGGCFDVSKEEALNEVFSSKPDREMFQLSSSMTYLPMVASLFAITTGN